MFDEPIDAISFGFEEDEIDLAVSGPDGVWHDLIIEKEFDPLLRESNLVMFPGPVKEIRLKGNTDRYVLHPIRISNDPIQYETAGILVQPRILTRKQWGADESFLYQGAPVTRSDTPQDLSSDNGSTNERVQTCNEHQKKYSRQFKVSHTITNGSNGKKLRWAHRYSPKVELLVVHHTALNVSNDDRSPLERVRALYEFHSNNRGWGDVGYHYLIDEKGQIYEGKSGGDYVVGGHVYCGNVGTVGVAMMGNFEEEKPTQKQMQSLMWLLDDLAKHYRVNLKYKSLWRGKGTNRIVGHKDLISTECPGYYVSKTMGQIRSNTLVGNFDTPIIFPKLASRPRQDESIARRISRLRSQSSNMRPTFREIGPTMLVGRPGSSSTIQILFRAGGATLEAGSRVADIKRSDSTIGLEQTVDGVKHKVRHALILPDKLLIGRTYIFRMHIKFPRKAGSYTLRIGNVTYNLQAEGRSIGREEEATKQTHTRKEEPQSNRTKRLRKRLRVTTPDQLDQTDDQIIRIRLGFNGDRTLLTTDNGLQVTLKREANGCTALDEFNRRFQTGIPRIDGQGGIFHIHSMNGPANLYRGLIECRIIDNRLVLINELPLEQYMAGLAEQPDSEPYEKQRAIAIAARSYAAHYMESENRKFPGMPYDGSDTGESFQNYGGYYFESRNPKWLEAARSTAGKVITKNGKIVKAAYFSSSDGRTRSPEEKGWIGFPFAEVFQSKPDPWCEGMELRGHGVGMSGCGSEAQANEGKTAEEILSYYYPGTFIRRLNTIQ